MSNEVKIRKIAVNTGGGDAPGLNAVIRAVTLSACQKGWECYGICNGYRGLMMECEDGIIRLTPDRVRGITHLGGTILGAANKGNPFCLPMEKDGGLIEIDASSEVVEKFHSHGFDALVAIGGEGSLNIAMKLYDMGIPVIGVPKTIDNDVGETDYTFGFDSAVTTATDAIDKLHPTAQAHDRVMVVELMGRYAGWITLYAGIAATADVILIPEIPYDIEKVCEKIMERERRGRKFSIVTVAEGARPMGGEYVTIGVKEPGREVRLGGISEVVAGEISAHIGKESRFIVLGHLLRGGTPTTFDRRLALEFGSAAVHFLEQGKYGHMVALKATKIVSLPLSQALSKLKTIPAVCDEILTARALGICLGD
jgi:6-phosphofructokinase 1